MMSLKNNRYIELGWKLLEYKAMYYKPEKIHPSWVAHLTIPDVEYDCLENEYNTLAKELGKPGITYVDFPEDKPSAQLVLSKLSGQRKI